MDTKRLVCAELPLIQKISSRWRSRRYRIFACGYIRAQCTSTACRDEITCFVAGILTEDAVSEIISLICFRSTLLLVAGLAGFFMVLAFFVVALLVVTFEMTCKLTKNVPAISLGRTADVLDEAHHPAIS